VCGREALSFVEVGPDAPAMRARGRFALEREPNLPGSPASSNLRGLVGIQRNDDARRWTGRGCEEHGVQQDARQHAFILPRFSRRESQPEKSSRRARTETLCEKLAPLV
jgi:hypothetical protein